MKDHSKIFKVIAVYGILYPINFLMAFMLGKERYDLGIPLMILAIVFEGLSVYYWIDAQTSDIKE